MKTHAAVAVLRLFNEKADFLLSVSFWRKNRDSGALIEWKRGRGWDGMSVGADEESIAALVLTARLFLQNNERISLGNIRAVYAGLRVDPQLAMAVTKHGTDLNAFLDSDTSLAIEEKRKLTYRDILKIFLYGSYAHTARRQRQTFEAIRGTPFFPIFQACLVDALVRLARAVRAIQSINEDALCAIRQPVKGRLPNTALSRTRFARR